MTRKTKVELTVHNINDASTSEIAEFAKSAAGLEFNEGASRDWMLSEIHAALGWQRQSIEDNATHVEITIASDPNVPGGTHPVPVNANGLKRYVIQRDKPVVVPVVVYNILADINEQNFEVLPTDKGDIPEDPMSRIVRKPVYALSIGKFMDKGAEA